MNPMTKKKKIKHLQKSLDAQAVIIAGYQDRNQILFDEVTKLKKELKGYKEWFDDKERLLKNAEQELQAIEKAVEEYKALYLSEVEARVKLVDIHANLTIKTDCEILNLEKPLGGCLKRCRDDVYKLLMAVSTPIGPDDFDRLIDDMKRIGKINPLKDQRNER